jgi:diadenosine tetraphosphate (Ap4A) HIT family hydrolase
MSKDDTIEFYKSRWLSVLEQLKVYRKKEQESSSHTLRKKSTEDKYQKYLNNDYNGECVMCRNHIFTKYDYWLEIENEFPYDRVFSSHVLLTPVRHVPDMKHLTVYELEELYSIMEEGKFDMMIYNSIKKQSQPQHLHFQLGKLIK